MAKNQTYKAFVARPSHVLDLDGELLDSAAVLASLASEVRDISAYATYVVRNDEVLWDELRTVTATAPSEAGRQAGVVMPDFLVVGKSGRSRKEKLVQHNVVASYRSYQERVKAANGESSRYVSQGWKRTVDASPPSYGEDYVNLGAMDRDVNAAANIAARAMPRVTKARVTRAKNRKLRPQRPLRTPPARDSLKYPGRDRTKNKPTPKRKNHRRTVREVILPLCPARAQAHSLEARVLADGGTVRVAGTSEAALKKGNATYKSRLCSLI